MGPEWGIDWGIFRSWRRSRQALLAERPRLDGTRTVATEGCKTTEGHGWDVIVKLGGLGPCGGDLGRSSYNVPVAKRQP